MIGVLAPAEVASAATDGQLSILAIGDSCTVGNGTGGFYGAENCYRSHDASSERFRPLVEENGSGQAVVYSNEACSGAATSDYWNSKDGWRSRREGADDRYDVIFPEFGW